LKSDYHSHVLYWDTRIIRALEASFALALPFSNATCTVIVATTGLDTFILLAHIPLATVREAIVVRAALSSSFTTAASLLLALPSLTTDKSFVAVRLFTTGTAYFPKAATLSRWARLVRWARLAGCGTGCGSRLRWGGGFGRSGRGSGLGGGHRWGRLCTDGASLWRTYITALTRHEHGINDMDDRVASHNIWCDNHGLGATIRCRHSHIAIGNANGDIPVIKDGNALPI
jgi:hypothetical protein